MINPAQVLIFEIISTSLAGSYIAFKCQDGLGINHGFRVTWKFDTDITSFRGYSSHDKRTLFIGLRKGNRLLISPCPEHLRQ